VGRKDWILLEGAKSQGKSGIWKPGVLPSLQVSGVSGADSLEAARGKSDVSAATDTEASFWSEDDLQQQASSIPRAVKSNLGPQGSNNRPLPPVKPRQQSVPDADNTFGRSIQVALNTARFLILSLSRLIAVCAEEQHKNRIWYLVHS
jgi:hypothetical protein